MALLSFADHSILSYGTFGMWGAFLAGKGETLLPSDLRKIGAGRQFATETAEIPNWTYLKLSDSQGVVTSTTEPRMKQ